MNAKGAGVIPAWGKRESIPPRIYFHRNRYLLSCLLIVLLMLAACQRGSSSDLSEIGMDLRLSPDPPVVGMATVTLALNDADNQPIAGAEVELEGNMNHAGMAPVFSQAIEVEAGRYEAPIQFTMGGDWFILVKVKLPDGRTLERSIDVRGVKTK